MVDIRTRDEWIASAEQTIPLLRDYADQFAVTRGTWNEDEANQLLADIKSGGKGFTRLANMFEKLWIALPDHAGIREHPFFDLCDLCSERWVGEE